MNIDEAKLFVGGISRETSEETLRNYFSKYGVVSHSLIAKDKITKFPRGFGFVVFSDPSSAARALQDNHVILGRTVSFLLFFGLDLLRVLVACLMLYYQFTPFFNKSGNRI